MKINAINTVSQMPKTLWQKVKRPALIAAVALPTMLATQSCGPLLWLPWFCPPAPCCPPPAPIFPGPCMPLYPGTYYGPHFHYGPCCDTTSVETAQKKMDVLG